MTIRDDVRDGLEVGSTLFKPMILNGENMEGTTRDGLCHRAPHTRAHTSEGFVIGSPRSSLSSLGGCVGMIAHV